MIQYSAERNVINMRIGIDLDGVITNIAQFVADYGTKFCYDNKIKYNLKPDEYDEQKALGISGEWTEKFWNRYLPYYGTKYAPREFAKEVIDILKEDNEIYIITARNEDGLPEELYGFMHEMVKGWFKEKEINYDKLIFTQGSKLPYCLENKIDIMIEDSPRNIKEISTKIPVLCFDNSYNKELKGNNITRVYSWYDILNKIKNNNACL